MHLVQYVYLWGQEIPEKVLRTFSSTRKHPNFTLSSNKSVSNERLYNYQVTLYNRSLLTYLLAEKEKCRCFRVLENIRNTFSGIS